MKQRHLVPFALLAVLALPLPGRAQVPAPKDFTPEPATVVRWQAGYRFPQAGWIAVHIEGAPYERGLQHGRLLPTEIAAYLRCFAALMNPKAPVEGWRTTRMFSNALFLRKFDQEQLEEMKGIADGAAAGGARFDNRPVDFVDIVALNCWAELMMLDQANAATPTGLEGVKWKEPQPQAKPQPGGEHCSAFVATGPATADGKVVFGHITMFGLYQSNFYNVWLDVKPAKGHRFVMCSFPGGIHSGMDYYLNAAGILISETTIAQTRLNVDGWTCAARIRKAIQYAGTIDEAVAILVKDGNGLYTNEWLLADINTNEIAMLELGTHKHKLWRSSKGEWFGNTPGFYWGCNNAKDVNVRLETVPSAKGKPASVVFVPQDRDVKWQELYQKHKGKIGTEFALEALTNPVLARHPGSLDAKFTTAALAKELKSWAVFGPPTGKVWQPNPREKEMFPEIKPLVRNEWTILGVQAPAADPANVTAAQVVPGKDAKGLPPPVYVGDELVWRGTLLPASDADVWLAVAFAEYHNAVSLEKTRLKRGEPAETARQKLQQQVDVYRKIYAATAKQGETALADIKMSTTSAGWYGLARSKGVLLLHQLRLDLGAEMFDRAMDEFGMKHGGQRVTAQEFQRHLEQASGRKLGEFFGYWLREKGLPQ
jgi:hypothetical protein